MTAAWLVLLMLAATPPGDGNDSPAARWLAEPTAMDVLAPVQRSALVAKLQRSSEALRRAGKLAQVDGAVAGLAWPLRPTAGFAPFGYTGTSGFVDHDPRFPGFVQDYSCGTRAYDLANGYNHGGSDYYLWPFPWRMMDRGEVAVVAAAAGVIIDKEDGHFDRGCAITGVGSSINAVYVRQDDGLIAWYLHMRKGSVTDVPIGVRVAAGDYLGLVGSSGSSSLPHLHFELTDTEGNVVDPRHGACNAAPERWIELQAYEAPRINTLSTHSAPLGTVACGVANGQRVSEKPFYRDRFMPGETLWVIASYSDHRNGQLTAFSILRPDGSVFAQWSFDLASQNLPRAFYSGTAWDWSQLLPADAVPGTWQVQAEFAGRTYRHAFEVSGSVDPNQHGLSGSWANPATGGQGIVMEVEPDFHGDGTGLLFGGWFTYDLEASGGRRWYTIQGQVHAGSVATTMPIYLSAGGAFDAPLATTTTPVGEVTLRFGDCMHGSLDYAFSDGSARSGTIPLTRLLANVTCTPQGDAVSDAASHWLSGAWADPANSGQGLVLDFNPMQQLLFGAWYTFAADANASSGPAGQRWYTLQAEWPAQARAGEGIGLHETRAGVFDRAAKTMTTLAGRADLVFHTCRSATLNYTFAEGVNAGRSGALELVRIGATPAGCDF